MRTILGRGLELRVSLILLIGVVFMALASGAYYWAKVAPALAAKRTAGEMVQLNAVLVAYPPTSLDARDLRRLATEIQEPISLEDAWGNSFVIDRLENGIDGAPRFSIRSLGHDGQLGDCCERWVDDFDEDAVLVGGEWVQLWR